MQRGRRSDGMSVQLKGVAALLAVVMLTLVQSSGYAIGKRTKKHEDIPMTPYQLRYATIDIPEGVTVIPDLSYEVNDDEKHVYIDVRIKEYDNDDIRAYFDKEIAELQYSNKIVDIVKQTSEDISGNKAAILRIEYKTDINFEMEFVEYVGILCEKRYIVFKAWGFLKLFTPGEHLWQTMYRSFRSDKSQPYKLPFGSFILPKEGVDYSRILLFFPNEDNYDMEISYIQDISYAQKKINEFKPNILSVLLKASVKVQQNKKIIMDSKKARYFEARITMHGETAVMMFFHILEDLKPGLEISITARNIDTFERYRPQMEAMIQSIVFENEN